jgi:hypothetical protein
MFILERYAIPTVAMVSVEDAARAPELAKARLNESPHHLSIELFENDAPLAWFDRKGEIWRKGEH